MQSIRLNPVAWSFLVVATILTIAVAIRGQEPASLEDAPYESQQPTNPANLEAQREQIWNSPDMLRARAWLQDYCSKSAKITPEEGKRYMAELENLTPVQMKLWLLKHDEAEQQRQQQYGLWQQAHAAGLSRALAADRATQQSYSAINQEETEAAGVAQQQVNEQTQAAQTMAENKQLDLSTGPYAPFGYAGYGGIHYHFHLYPYPY